jgi:hypothetical protein
MAQRTVADFRVGSVIARGISVFFRNIIAFVIVTVILFIVPILLTAFVFPSWGQELGGALSILIWMIAYFWLSAALVYGVVSDLRGNRAGVGEILGGAFSVLIPVFFVSIVVGVLVSIGTMLLIIPGIILYVMFWVAVPAAVVERSGVMDSMKRSLELTKSFRWQIFFVMLIWLVISFVVQFVVAAIIGLSMGGAMMGDPTANSAMAVGMATGPSFVALIINMLLGGISASILAVGYHDLRIAKEGVDSAEIARTFD